MTSAVIPRDDEIPPRCPVCGGMDTPGASPTIEINNGTYTCIACGWSWPIPLPPPPGDPR